MKSSDRNLATCNRSPLATILTAAVISVLPLLSDTAHATKSATIPVICGQSKLQSVIDNASGDVETTILVTGRCVENITVQPERNIILQGVNGASITPRNVNGPAIRVRGSTLVLKNITVSNATGSAYQLVEASEGATLSIVGSILSAPGVDVVADYMDAGGSIINSRLVGGVSDTTEATFGSSLHIIADPSYTGGLNGSRMEIIGRDGGNGAGCWMGSTLSLEVYTTNGVSGALSISGASIGLMGRSCSIVTRNNSNSTDNLALRNNKSGVSLTASSAFLRNILIENSMYHGVSLSQSNVQLASSRLRNNNVDIQARFGSSVVMESYWGRNDVPGSTSPPYNSFVCEGGGRFDIESGAILQNIAGLYDGQCVRLY